MGTAAMLRSDVVSAAMAAAASATGMEVVFIGGLSAETFTFQRVHGQWAGLHEGLQIDRTDSFCARLLSGAPTATCNASADPAYRSVSAVSDYGVASYVGVPIRAADGTVLGTLCGIDRSSVAVDETAVAVLRNLAALLAAHLSSTPPAGVVIRRTPAGWQVADTDAAEDLTTALTLADLLAEDEAISGRPPRPDPDLDAVGRLRLSVAQLEHALAARVIVEQAIGVLAERQRVLPRAAFERLRRAARSRGRRVHVLAREVVASAHDPAVPLPPELAGRRP